MLERKTRREREGEGNQRDRTYLTRDGDRIRLVRALDNAADALEGTHDLSELVCVEVCKAWDGTRRAHEYV
jgi:hypothetical protein